MNVFKNIFGKWAKKRWKHAQLTQPNIRCLCDCAIAKWRT